MGEPKTGITTATPTNLILSEGAVYADYGEVSERLLGATKPGGSFNANRSFVSPDVSGTRSKVAGMLFRDRVEPQLKVTILEMTLENLMLAFAGSNSTPAGGRTMRYAEYVGVGNGILVAFNLDEDFVYDGSLRIWQDIGAGPVLQTEGATDDYTVNYATGVVTFNAAPPDATAGTSRSAVAPTLDMSLSVNVNMNVAVDGGVPTAVTFVWAGCVNGAATATQIETAIQALGGDFAAVTCAYVPNVPGVSDYYEITSGTTGVGSSFIVTDAGINNAAVELQLGLTQGGTEPVGADAAALLAGYAYDPGDGVATDDLITGGPVETTDHLINVAWIGTAQDATDPVVIRLFNPAVVDATDIPFSEKVLAVEVTFEGFTTLSAPLAEPWDIRRPRA